MTLRLQEEKIGLSLLYAVPKIHWASNELLTIWVQGYLLPQACRDIGIQYSVGLYIHRVDSRVRDLRIICSFGPRFQTACVEITLNDENWRIAVLSVRIWVSLKPGKFRLFPTFSVSLVLREPFEIEFGTVILVDWIT